MVTGKMNQLEIKIFYYKKLMKRIFFLNDIYFYYVYLIYKSAVMALQIHWILLFFSLRCNNLFSPVLSKMCRIFFSPSCRF